MLTLLWFAGPLALLGLSVTGTVGQIPDFRIGVAGHAFDHLGAIGEQADAALASGATIL